MVLRVYYMCLKGLLYVGKLAYYAKIYVFYYTLDVTA